MTTPYEAGAAVMQRLAAQLVLDKQGALGSVSLVEAIASISLDGDPASVEGRDSTNPTESGEDASCRTPGFVSTVDHSATALGCRDSASGKCPYVSPCAPGECKMLNRGCLRPLPTDPANSLRCGYCNGTGLKSGEPCGGCDGTGTPGVFRADPASGGISPSLAGSAVNFTALLADNAGKSSPTVAAIIRECMDDLGVTPRRLDAKSASGDINDEISEALSDAVNDGDGRPRRDALQRHLEKRGLMIVRALHADPASGEGADAIEALDKAFAGKAAELANKRFGQWMPERWLYLFVEEYNKLRATK